MRVDGVEAGGVKPLLNFQTPVRFTSSALKGVD